jgi:hypothetical protein
VITSASYNFHEHMFSRHSIIRTFINFDNGPFLIGHKQEELTVILYTDNSKSPRQYRILGIEGGDYEECRLLGYKNPVRTSQETHYVSATEPSRLMLCKS